MGIVFFLPLRSFALPSFSLSLFLILRFRFSAKIAEEEEELSREIKTNFRQMRKLQLNRVTRKITRVKCKQEIFAGTRFLFSYSSSSSSSYSTLKHFQYSVATNGTATTDVVSRSSLDKQAKRCNGEDGEGRRNGHFFV